MKKKKNHTRQKKLPEAAEPVDACYGGGAVFILTNHHDGIAEREAFVLADCYEEGKVFQIVQITGCHAGWMAGYVNEGILKDSCVAITHEELVEAIKYNFLGPDFNTMQILDKGLKLEDLSID